METPTSTDARRYRPIRLIVVASAIAGMLLGGLLAMPSADAQEQDPEPEYAVAFYAFDTACGDGFERIYAGWNSERSDRPVYICYKSGFVPVDNEAQCQFGGTWDAALSSCLFRRHQSPPACLAPAIEIGEDCWFVLLTDRNLEPEPEPEPDPDPDPEPDPEPDKDDENEKDDKDEEDDKDDNKNDEAEDEDEVDEVKPSRARSVPAPPMPLCAETKLAQEQSSGQRVGQRVTDGSTTYVIVSGTGCEFNCYDGWDANCDGRIGDFCPVEYDMGSVRGIGRCMEEYGIVPR